VSSLRPTLAILAFATACDEVYGLSGRDDPDARTGGDAANPTDATAPTDTAVTCFAERFDGAYVDIAPRWDRYAGDAVAMATVDVHSGALAFELPIAATRNYAGIIRNVPTDLTNRSIVLEIADAATSPENFEIFIKLYDNAETDRYYKAAVDGTKMHFMQVSGVTADDQTFEFDPVTHRHWRIRHDTNLLVLETSADRVTYTHRIARPSANVPITQLRLEIGSGTDAVQGAVLRPRVDNFELCP
jgi:hypothetical protein